MVIDKQIITIGSPDPFHITGYGLNQGFRPKIPDIYVVPAPTVERFEKVGAIFSLTADNSKMHFYHNTQGDQCADLVGDNKVITITEMPNGIIGCLEPDEDFDPGYPSGTLHLFLESDSVLVDFAFIEKLMNQFPVLEKKVEEFNCKTLVDGEQIGQQCLKQGFTDISFRVESGYVLISEGSFWELIGKHDNELARIPFLNFIEAVRQAPITLSRDGSVTQQLIIALREAQKYYDKRDATSTAAVPATPTASFTPQPPMTMTATPTPVKIQEVVPTDSTTSIPNGSRMDGGDQLILIGGLLVALAGTYAFFRLGGGSLK